MPFPSLLDDWQEKDEKKDEKVHHTKSEAIPKDVQETHNPSRHSSKEVWNPGL